MEEKCASLAQMILAAKHVVVHTGAGISTSSGIPDFRFVSKYFQYFLLQSINEPKFILLVGQKVSGH